jgi:hypothetical protein
MPQAGIEPTPPQTLVTGLYKSNADPLGHLVTTYPVCQVVLIPKQLILLFWRLKLTTGLFRASSYFKLAILTVFPLHNLFSEDDSLAL